MLTMMVVNNTNETILVEIFLHVSYLNMAIERQNSILFA